jgi:predicted hydrocarbon binding protein
LKLVTWITSFDGSFGFPMAATVDARLPLSLLQAVRQLDVPEGDTDTEYVSELRNKRLGLSDTVYAQVQRYTEAVRRSQRTTFAEAAALARLLGRRPDAEEVFRWAGRYLAVQGYQTISPVTRRTLRLLPALLARPLALRHTRRLARRLLDGRVERKGASILLRVPAPVTADATPDAVGCAFYAATLRELMRLLVGADGMVEHVRCAERGEGSCEWRAEWRRDRG